MTFSRESILKCYYVTFLEGIDIFARSVKVSQKGSGVSGGGDTVSPPSEPAETNLGASPGGAKLCGQ